MTLRAKNQKWVFLELGNLGQDVREESMARPTKSQVQPISFNKWIKLKLFKNPINLRGMTVLDLEPWVPNWGRCHFSIGLQ
ncbi:hypothetical protein MTR_8g011970 [Medicago truncatula]|uniref:Uncharacterized protein n=1 Tax=Medicago truncatula TaxID=3880 RepID=G7LF32_MEDTR|nr:hypothetical protein MTR_8g011970 [Medicago truncatula]